MVILSPNLSFRQPKCIRCYSGLFAMKQNVFEVCGVQNVFSKPPKQSKMAKNGSKNRKPAILSRIYMPNDDMTTH